MTEPSWPASVDLASYLPDVQTAQVKLRLAAPVVLLAADLGRQVPRRVGLRNASELVAALLVRAARHPETLGDMIGDYRETQAHAVLNVERTEGMYELPPRPALEL